MNLAFITIVLLANVLALVTGQATPEMNVCGHRMRGEMEEAKKKYEHVVVNSNPHNQTQESCKVDCQMMAQTFPKPKIWPTKTFQSPDFVSCGERMSCVGGKCVEKQFCREMMKSDVEAAEKRGEKVEVHSIYKEDGEPCMTYCQLTGAKNNDVKWFQSPDYHMCGMPEGGDGMHTNYCLDGKCLGPDGTSAKNPQPTMPVM